MKSIIKFVVVAAHSEIVRAELAYGLQWLAEKVDPKTGRESVIKRIIQLRSTTISVSAASNR
jgi:hypothetical protein